jgi:hypothetical protein
VNVEGKYVTERKPQAPHGQELATGWSLVPVKLG